jgi:hypothetical protein
MKFVIALLAPIALTGCYEMEARKSQSQTCPNYHNVKMREYSGDPAHRGEYREFYFKVCEPDTPQEPQVK